MRPEQESETPYAEGHWAGCYETHHTELDAAIDRALPAPFSPRSVSNFS